MARFDNEFAEFFAARFDRARRTAYAMCGDWVEAEELAQNGFVRLYSHWPRIAKDNPDAYLRTVITRLFLDGRRRGRKRERLVADLPDDFRPNPRQPEFSDRVGAGRATLPLTEWQLAELGLAIVGSL